jgi:hypothetical protein
LKGAGLERRLALGLAPIALAALAVVHLIQDRVLLYDAVTLFAPYFTLVADFTASQQLLLWNPWSNCGSPDLAYVEMGSFSPLTLALAGLTGGGDAGFLLYWIAIWTIGATGVARLGLHLGAPGWGAGVVSLAFAFSGFYLGHATHTSWLYGFSFLPWIAWRLDVALLEERWWPAVEAGALYGLSALAGHPALVILNGLYLGAWALGRCVTSPRGSAHVTPSLRGAVGRLALLVGVACLVLSPAYVAFFVEAAGYSERVGALPRDVVVASQAFPAGALATFASPYLPVLGLLDLELWPGTWHGLTGIYLGAVVPVLALLALIQRPRDVWRWWLLGTGLLALGCALGPALPLRGWLYDWVFPTRYFRHSAVMRTHFLFSLSLLAMLGAGWLTRRDDAARSARLRAFAISVVLGALAVVAWRTLLGAVAETGESIGRATLQLFWAWGGAATLFGLAWWRRPGSAGWRFVPLLFVVYGLVDAGLAFRNAELLVSLPREEVGVKVPERQREVDKLGAGLLRNRIRKGALLNNMNLYNKVPTLENFNTLNNRFHTRRGVRRGDWSPLETSWSDEPVLAGSVIGRRSRIWFARQVLETERTDAVFEAFVARSRRLGAMPLVVHDPEAMRRFGGEASTPGGVGSLPAARRLPIDLERYSPTELSFRVRPPASGWLLVTDRWARGWRASLDGEPVELWGGNFLFRALRVEPGEHEVTFRYKPFAHPALLILSWATLLAVAARIIVFAVRCRSGGTIHRSELPRALHPGSQIKR